ncbi:MAG: response regulator [Peptococcaceae bacterium]|nr:response regulator [Peptococcaceae bacterium]
MDNIFSANILIWDQVSSIRSRLRAIFEKLNISVYEASNSTEVFNIMDELNNNLDAVIMDIENDIEMGFEVLAKIKRINPQIPIIILTANSKRHIFTRGIIEGASDYILKPFEDDVLRARVLAHLRKRHDQAADNETVNEATTDAVNEVLLDIRGYLHAEFKKADKGKYDVTVMMCTYFLPVKVFTSQLEKSYLSLSDYIYSGIKSVVWDTDIFVKYGSQAFIGIFPFCDSASRLTLTHKLEEKFAVLKAENTSLAKFHLAFSAVSFPSESVDAQGVLTILSDGMKKSIDAIKAGEISDGS